MIKSLLIAGVGSFIGGSLRFLISELINQYASTGFLRGTFVVNIVGCFLVGIFSELIARHELLDTNYRIFLIVGICGGLTTFSAFIFENVLLMKMSDYCALGLNIFLSIIFGIVALIAGQYFIKLF